MSKKLIAIAAAVALSIGGFAAMPANAAATGSASAGISWIDADGTSGDGLTTLTPIVAEVPWDNSINGVSGAFGSSDSAVEFEVLTNVATNVTVTSTGSVRILDEVSSAANKYTSASGKTSFAEYSGVAKRVTFVAYTTSTTPGTLTIAHANFSVTLYFNGLAGPAYNIAVTAPDFVAANGNSVDYSAVVTDVFGNAVDTLVYGAGARATSYGDAYIDTNTVGGVTTSTLVYSSTTEVYEGTLTASAAGLASLAVNLYEGTTGTTAITAVSGLPKPKTSFFTNLNSTDLKEQVAALSAKLSALQATLAATVSKKKYNKLVRKWNKKHSPKLALLK